MKIWITMLQLLKRKKKIFTIHINYIIDTSLDMKIIDTLFKVKDIYEKIGVNIKFTLVGITTISIPKSITITNLFQIMGLFKLDLPEYFETKKNSATLLLSCLPVSKKETTSSFNLDIKNGFSIILCNLYNSNLQKCFTEKQKTYIIAHEIAHHLGASHTAKKIINKFTIMNPFVPDDTKILLKFSNKTKKDIRDFLEKFY